MIARISSATEKALLRVDAGASMYAAARAEGIAYSTMWKAVQRKKGAAPLLTKAQKNKRNITITQKTALVLHKAFVISDKFARYNDEYVRKHSKNADLVLELIRIISLSPNSITSPASNGNSIAEVVDEITGELQDMPPKA